MEQPTHQPEGDRIRPGAVIGGLVAGFALSWLVFALVVLGLYSAYGDSSSTTQNVIAYLGLAALPVALGLLLVRRRTRHWGAGLLMGLAIGAMTGAGVCAGFMGINAG